MTLVERPAQQAVDALYESYVPTIRWLANKHAPFTEHGLTADDLVQIGSLAFLEALDQWNLADPGHRTWMRKVINTAMVDALRSMQNVVRLPVKVWRLRTDVATTEGYLAHELSRPPTIAELAAALGEQAETINELKHKAAPVRSLDETVPDSTQLALELADRDSWEMADKIAIRLERQAHVDHILKQLPKATADVIRLKWGLTPSGIEHHNKQIAFYFDKSSEWVRLRLREAERHIRLIGLDRTRRRDVALTAHDVQALLDAGDLAWYKLTGADLTGADLTKADLTGADLTGANLTRTNLTQADLAGRNLTGATLIGAILIGTNLARAHLTGADLREADLTDANLIRANLARTDLTGARLTETHLFEANLREADLTDADLTHADLTEADLTGANLTWTNLTNTNLQEAHLTRAKLIGATLARADLTGATLGRADLTGATLARANLTDADLTRANLTDADLTRANLTDTDFNEANLTGADLTAADLTGTYLTTADLTDTDLSNLPSWAQPMSLSGGPKLRAI